MKRAPLALLFAIPLLALAQTYPVKSSANSRYFVDQGDTPFMMVGDSPHAMLAALSVADATTYIQNRSTYGINTLWVEVICTAYIPNCRSNLSTYDGIEPFTGGDLATPNETYFARLDAMVSAAAASHIQLLLDTWETGAGMPMLRSAGNTKAFNYGAYLGNRYKDMPNITWITGNDFQTWTTPSDNTLIKNIMDGIASVDANHMQTVQLNYFVSYSTQDTALTEVAANGAYTYYATYDDVLDAYNDAVMPLYLQEANYENENNNGLFTGVADAPILRKQEYWTATSGASGQLYGSSWTAYFQTGYAASMDSTGVAQLKIMKDFFAPLRWYDLAPDQTHSLVTAGYGTYQDGTTGGDLRAANYVTGAITADGMLAVIYNTAGATITVAMDQMAGAVTARWFDPVGGTFTEISGSPFVNSGTRNFATPGNNADGDADWVLLLEASSFSGITSAGPITLSGQSARK